MPYKTIIVDKTDDIGILTFNRPSAANALTKELADEASNALEKLAKDSKVRALIINAGGKNFCMGDDGEVQFLGRKAIDILIFLDAVSRMKQLIADFPKGVVVAAQGLAVMTGTEITALADIAVASEDAKFGIIGINYATPCIPTLHNMRNSLGAKKALQLMITGEMFGAEKALDLGLVDKVVPKNKLFEAAVSEAKMLASKNPMAMAFAKRASAAIRNMSVGDASKYLNENAAVYISSKDSQEELKATYTKRKKAKK